MIPSADMNSTQSATHLNCLYVAAAAPHGQGIHRFAIEPDGGLRPLGHTLNTGSPSWLLADEAQGVVYAANEASHTVSVYRVEADGVLCLQQEVPSGGRGPVHLSFLPGSLMVAHYGSAELALLPLGAEGVLGPARVWKSAEAGALVGPTRAERAPPGSHAVSGHDAPHLHMARLSPQGRHVLATDLGLDRLIVWPLRQGQGGEPLGASSHVAMSPGSGPRHFVFHPRHGRFVYVLQEESSTLSWLAWDGEAGRLQMIDEISVLPPGFAGTSFASDLLVAPTGRHLYALNRLHDAVSVLALDESGRPHWQAQEWTRGSYPRSATLSPDGRFLYVCNQRSDHLTVFACEPEGGLRFTGHYVPVPSPTSAVALAD